MNRYNCNFNALVKGLVFAYALLTLIFSGIDAKAFVELVRKMRVRQNAYYRKGRKQSDQIASKELEKQVDAALLDGISFAVEEPVQDNFSGWDWEKLMTGDGNNEPT